jgi:hypothetical protein
MSGTTDQRVLTEHTRRYDLPGTLDALRGPSTGPVHLPDTVYWGPESVVDLAYDDDVLKAYEAVLREGNHAEICAIVNEGLLRSFWARAVLPSPIRRAWEARFPELRS